MRNVGRFTYDGLNHYYELQQIEFDSKLFSCYAPVLLKAFNQFGPIIYRLRFNGMLSSIFTDDPIFIQFLDENKDTIIRYKHTNDMYFMTKDVAVAWKMRFG